MEENNKDLADSIEEEILDKYNKKRLKEEFLTMYIRENIKEIRLMNADQFQKLKRKLKKDMKKMNLQ